MGGTLYTSGCHEYGGFNMAFVCQYLPKKKRKKDNTRLKVDG